MKDLAVTIASLAILFYLMGTIAFSAKGTQWELERSPSTGICYEVVTRHIAFYAVKDSHPVDSSFCEKEETT